MKVLFVPSSGTKGSGETLNAFQIYQFLKFHFENLESIIFLHEASNFIEESPIPVIKVKDTPTRCNTEILPFFQKLKPDITFFIGAGSKQQIRESKQNGAINIFISFSDNLRSRGLKFGRIQHIDLHLVDQYEFMLNKLSNFEKIKCFLWKKATPKYWGPIFNKPSKEKITATLVKYNLQINKFILVSTGSGAESDSKGLNFSESIYQALKNQNFSDQVIQSFGKAYPHIIPESSTNYSCINYLQPDEFICLMISAKIVVTNGGGSLIQAISLQKKSLSCPMVDDQFPRVEICGKLGLTTEYSPFNILEKINALKDENKEHSSLIKIPNVDALKLLGDFINKNIKNHN